MKTRNELLSNVMQLAWQFVKTNGMSLSEALRTAWRNVKLRAAIAVRIVKFYFQKVDGTTREAYGTLAERLLPPTQGVERRSNDTVQTYYDTEVKGYRCFKKANLLSIA